MDTLTRLVRALVFGIIAIIGIVMAVVFTLSTVLAVIILYVTAKFRARPFNAQEYWTTRQSKRNPAFQKGIRSRSRHDDITDVQARDIP